MISEDRRPIASMTAKRSKLPKDVPLPVHTGSAEGKILTKTGVRKNAKTAWTARDHENSLKLMLVPFTIEATCPKTDSPLQAMIAFDAAIINMNPAAEAAAILQPEETSKKPPISGLAKPSPKTALRTH